jgi:hypothetical protein
MTPPPENCLHARHQVKNEGNSQKTCLQEEKHLLISLQTEKQLQRPSRDTGTLHKIANAENQNLFFTTRTLHSEEDCLYQPAIKPAVFHLLH